MYRTVKDFLNDWEYESGATAKVFEALTSESLDQKVWSEGRTLKKLVWHIVLGNMKMLGDGVKSTNDFNMPSGPDDDVHVIVGDYKKSSSFLMHVISSEWNDSDLLTKIDIYGQRWERGKLLGALIMHQAHHRAQITVLMRQAGLKVPGVYGPSKEEWQNMGMAPQE